MMYARKSRRLYFVPLPVCRLISRHILADPASGIGTTMPARTIDQTALVKSTDNSGNSYNIGASRE